MELQFENKTVRYLRQNLCEVKEQEQTQEVRLPDGMPDLGRILGAWGQCVMRGKEWNNDNIGTSGGVMAWVLYQPAEESQPQVVEAWLPIQLKWNMPSSSRTGHIRCSWLLKGVDGRILSARKLMVRANVSVMAQAVEPNEAEVSGPSEVEPDIQLLRNVYPARLNVEAGEKTFLIDEDMALPQPAPEKLICYSMTPQITEQKVLGGKAVFRGYGMFHLLYQGTDGRLHTHDHKVEFSQFADLDHDHDKDAQITSVVAISSLEPELLENSLRIKCGVVVQYLVNELRMLELVEDAYSTSRQITIKDSQLQLPMLLDSRQETIRISCVLGDRCDQMVALSLCMEQPQIRRAGDLTELSLDGQAHVIYYDENGALQGCTGRWSGKTEMPAAIHTDVMALVQGIGAPQIVHSAQQTEVGAEVTMETVILSADPLTMVTGLELGQPQQADPARPSLILRRAGDGSLWEIAKGAGSTVNAIRRANGLTGEPVDDRILLIPVV